LRTTVVIPVTVTLIALATIEGAAAQTVTVMVVPYVDSDAWQPSHVDAFEKFLEWCKQNGVHIAVFHYNTNTAKDSNGVPITEVIKQYANEGVITMVGLHSTSHSIDGLPLSIQYWELKFNLQFLQKNIGKNVMPVFSVPYWVFDPNTVKACAMIGIKAIISGQSVATLNPNYSTPISQLNPIAQRMIPGYFQITVNGRTCRVYYIPAVSFWDDLVPQAKSANETVDDLLKSAVDQLIQSDIFSTPTGGKDVTLELWVLIHPWEMADTSRGASAYENFLEDVKSGKLNHTVNVNGVNVNIVFKLADPVEALNEIINGKTPLVPMPEPSLYYLLEMQGFEPWWQLKETYQSNPDKISILIAWRDIMEKLWSLDGELMALTKSGMITGNLENELLSVIENVWSVADINCVLKYWDVTAAKVDVEKEDSLVDVLAADVSEAFANLIAKNGGQSEETQSKPSTQTHQTQQQPPEEPTKKPSQPPQPEKGSKTETSKNTGGTKGSSTGSHGAPLLPIVPPIRRRRC